MNILYTLNLSHIFFTFFKMLAIPYKRLVYLDSTYYSFNVKIQHKIENKPLPKQFCLGDEVKNSCGLVRLDKRRKRKSVKAMRKENY